ncbi:hypothetical protein TYRP_017469 [Tyrophagus putrescentiae]|nr:hypothetical protein TYRP_017469 [Tyrophagus putrescentiae]
MQHSARVSFSVNLTSSAGGGESGDAVCSNDGWSAPVWTAFNYASLSNDSYYDDVKSYADYHQYHLSSGSAREHYSLQCPKGWTLYRSKTKTEDDPSKCIKLIGPDMNNMLFSEAQEYCTEKLPQLETDLVEPQMLRLTSAAQETFLRGFFYLPGAEKRGTSWFLHLGLQYRPEDGLWHWAASGVYEPGKSGPPVGEGYALEKAKHTFDEYNYGRYGNPFKPNYPMCLFTPSWIVPAVEQWSAVKCEEDKFRLICESKPKKVEMPDNAENVCESSWEVYKEQKCIKLIDTAGLQSFAEAEKTCTANGNSRLVSVNFAEKQTFLVEYLFTKKAVVDGVWLGAKYDSAAHQFHWETDGSNSNSKGLTYTNWAAKNPKNNALADSCIQFHSEGESKGQWGNEPCSKKNLVLCERPQNWSSAKMQEVIVEMMLNQVPLGFIYVQLPKEKSPQEIWPWMSWTDVSDQYDSTFFRVAGSKSKEFGAVQEEFSPHIDEIKNSICYGSKCRTKFDVNGETMAMNFHTATGEVRPRNMAVKVWKRTG